MLLTKANEIRIVTESFQKEEADRPPRQQISIVTRIIGFLLVRKKDPRPSGEQFAPARSNHGEALAHRGNNRSGTEDYDIAPVDGNVGGAPRTSHATGWLGKAVRKSRHAGPPHSRRSIRERKFESVQSPPRHHARRSYHGGHPTIANKDGRSAGRSTLLDLASQHAQMGRGNNGFPCSSDRYCHLFFPERLSFIGCRPRTADSVHRGTCRFIGFLRAELPKGDVTDSYQSQCDQCASLLCPNHGLAGCLSLRGHSCRTDRAYVAYAYGHLVGPWRRIRNHRGSQPPGTQPPGWSPAVPCSSTLVCALEPWPAESPQLCDI